MRGPLNRGPPIFPTTLVVIRGKRQSVRHATRVPMLSGRRQARAATISTADQCVEAPAPNLPTNIVPTYIALLKLSGKSPMDMRIPPLQIKILLESNPLKSTICVGGLAVGFVGEPRSPFVSRSARLDNRAIWDPTRVSAFVPSVYP